ncbi:MAG: hypothetical protein ABIH01_00555, partial [Candidatus Omnitrophota bacterium]
GELIEALRGTNNKKQIACASFSLDELASMQKYLVSPKQQELVPFIEELQRISKKISEGSLSDGTKATLRVSLERHRRRILNDFYLSKVKDYIKPDEPAAPAIEEE